MKVNFRIALMTNRTYADGTHPVVIWLSQKKQRKIKATGFSVKEKDFSSAKERVKESHNQHRVINKKLRQLESTYQNTITQLMTETDAFSLETLIERAENPIRVSHVFEYVDELSARIKKSGKVKNGMAIFEAGRSFKKFRKDRDLLFSEITLSMLHKYKEYLEEKGLKAATKHFYFRTLNTIYKRAIIDGLAKEEQRPFVDFNISKTFKVEANRRAISFEDIEKVINFKAKTEKQQLAVDYFGFSFYARGINFIDFAKLTWQDVTDTHVTYTRSKVSKKITFPIKNVTHYFEKYRSSEKYIFPILSSFHNTPQRVTNRIDKVRGQVNAELKKVGEELGIENLTTYVARHSWATNTLRRGASIQAISEGLAHADIGQTADYIKSLDTESLDKELDRY